MVARFKNAGEVLEVPLPVRFPAQRWLVGGLLEVRRPFGRRGGEGRQARPRSTLRLPTFVQVTVCVERPTPLRIGCLSCSP